MLSGQILESENIKIRDIEESDCGQGYLGWLNNPAVNQFLETRLQEQSLQTIREFVVNTRESGHSILFAIIDKVSQEHIGNIKLGPIHPEYHHADVSYFIGNTLFWGKGYATEAVKLVCTYGFEILKLHRLQAGVIEGNVISEKVLQRSGFLCEARLKDKFIVDGQYRDHILYSQIR